MVEVFPCHKSRQRFRRLQKASNQHRGHLQLHWEKDTAAYTRGMRQLGYFTE